MGERERSDSKKVLEGKHILNIKTPKLWELFLEPFLYPYRAWKNKKRREEIRKDLFKSMKTANPVSEEVQKNWVYKTVSEDNEVKVDKDNWLHDFISENDTKNKGDN